MTKYSRIDAAIAQAKELSDTWIGALPMSASKRRANAERITEVCQRLVSARPVQEPTHRRIAEEGAALYQGFPSVNYVQNHFRELVRHWRSAYERIIDVSAPTPAKRNGSFEISQDALRALDAGTRALVQLVQAHAKNLKKENDRLREIIGDKRPVPTSEGAAAIAAERRPAVDALQVMALRSWLTDVRNGRNGLELAEPGVRTTRHTRPGILIVPACVLEAVQAVCGASEALAATGPSPALSTLAEPCAD